jgi:hypothetical protein
MTHPIDETAVDAVERFNQVADALTLIAKEVNVKTTGLTRRADLAEIVPSAPPKAHVGLDTARYEAPQLQALDANIQATVGVDLGQVTTLLSKLGKQEDTTGSGPILAEHYNFIAKQESLSASLAKAIVEHIVTKRSQEKKVDLKEAQGLVNLQGMIALTLLYLRTAAAWTSLSEKKSKIVGKMTLKNFTPLLSHTDLRHLQSMLTDEELLYVIADEDFLLDAILKFAAWKLPKPDLKAPMLKWGARDPIGPTPEEFVSNVLNGKEDGLTSRILPKGKQFGGEEVGPIREDGQRRKAPVIEMRSLSNKLSELQSKLGSTKFPPEAWTVLCSEIFFTIRKLSMKGADQA